MMITRRYSELQKLNTFGERFEYLILNGTVGDRTFGSERYLNQLLYKSHKWRKTRDFVIIRDSACDLGIQGRDIHDKIVIHHINPISIEDVKEQNPIIFEPEFLICTTFQTHSAIHYGTDALLYRLPDKRYKNDMCPWKK